MGHSAVSLWGPHLCHGSLMGSCVVSHDMGGVNCAWVTLWGVKRGRPCDNGVTHSEKVCKRSKLFSLEAFVAPPGCVYSIFDCFGHFLKFLGQLTMWW